MFVDLNEIAVLSPLRHKNTTLKVFLVLFGIFAGLLSDTPVLPFFMGSCIVFATLFFGKIPFSFYSKIFALTLAFASISCLMLLITFSNNESLVLFSYPVFGRAVYVTAQSLNFSILVFSRAFNGIAFIFFLSLTTPMIELFSYFKKIKFLDVLMELTMLIYRYIFVFISLLFSIQFAQKMRFGYRNFKSGVYSAGLLVGSLFVQTIEQGDRLLLSMNSRCYDGKLPYYEASYKIKAPDILLSAAFVILTAAVYVYTQGYQFF